MTICRFGMACVLAVTVSITNLAAADALEYRVRSPDASSFDIEQRRALLATTSDPVLRAALMPYKSDENPRSVCARHEDVTPVSGAFTIPPFYLDREKWQAATKPFHALEMAATELAAHFVISGDGAYARCLFELLERWAAADALSGFAPGLSGQRQAWYQTTWTIASATLAYGIIRAEPTLEPDRRRIVEDWFRRVAGRVLAVNSSGTDARNNHAHWRALMATATGVATGDDGLLSAGVLEYHHALARLSADGSWPLEMARKKRAVHYQNFALEPLIMLRVLAMRQGIDLHSGAEPDPLLHALAFLLAAIADPDTVRPLADAEQDLSFLKAARHTSPLAGLEILAGRELRDEAAMAGALETLLAPVRPITDRRLAAAATLFYFQPPN